MRAASSDTARSKSVPSCLSSAIQEPSSASTSHCCSAGTSWKEARSCSAWDSPSGPRLRMISRMSARRKYSDSPTSITWTARPSPRSAVKDQSAPVRSLMSASGVSVVDRASTTMDISRTIASPSWRDCRSASVMSSPSVRTSTISWICSSDASTPMETFCSFQDSWSLRASRSVSFGSSWGSSAGCSFCCPPPSPPSWPPPLPPSSLQAAVNISAATPSAAQAFAPWRRSLRSRISVFSVIVICRSFPSCGPSRDRRAPRSARPSPVSS